MGCGLISVDYEGFAWVTLRKMNPGRILIRGIMKTGFPDRSASKNQKPKDQPQGGKNSPWDFRQPAYDERCGRFVNAGTDYGVGVNQPVGHTGKTKLEVPCLPRGRVNTLNVQKP